MAKRSQMELQRFELTKGGDVCYITRVNHLSRLYCNKKYQQHKGMPAKVQALANDLVTLAAEAKRLRADWNTNKKEEK